MLQKDGSLLLCRGFFGAESDGKPYIRWVQRMVSSGQTASEEASLREKYPEFFDLDISTGLTVYISRFSPENYACYLVSSATDTPSDRSFFFGKSASMAEMRTILSLYGMGRDRVTLEPRPNPLSSYAYVIDDAYREALETRFREETLI